MGQNPDVEITLVENTQTGGLFGAELPHKTVYDFGLLFPGSGIKIIHSGTMIIRVLDFNARLTAADILALRTLDWVPLGVGWQLWQGEPDCFGFAGSELQPFDQAPFLSESALTIYD